jgi:hypothetical protein
MPVSTDWCLLSRTVPVITGESTAISCSPIFDPAAASSPGEPAPRTVPATQLPAAASWHDNLKRPASPIPPSSGDRLHCDSSVPVNTAVPVSTIVADSGHSPKLLDRASCRSGSSAAMQRGVRRSGCRHGRMPSQLRHTQERWRSQTQRHNGARVGQPATNKCRA